MKRGIILFIMLLLAACQPQGVEEPETETAVLPDPTQTAEPTETAVPAETAVPPTEAPAVTEMPAEEPTAVPTETAVPTATSLPLPTPIAAPDQAEFAIPQGVTQPPYAESECSDKYPCNEDVEAWEARIQVPDGFVARYHARIDGNPTTMTFGPDGLLYLGTMTGEIVTVNAEGESETYIEGLIVPAGLAFQPGTERLFVSSRLINQGIDGEAQISVVEDGEISQLLGGFPCCYTSYHSANGIAFGPDGYGYVGVGARADHGEILDGSGRQDELHPWEATIMRFHPDGSELEPYAFGLRNAYDIAFGADGKLWASENQPDFDPPEEIHLVVPGEEHGYPWYDCDVCFSAPDDVELVPPIATFPHSVSPTGITVYLGQQFPGYFDTAFVTLWSAFEGAQKVSHVTPDGQGPHDFAMGFAAPIDVVMGPDEALYVADWATGIIFQIAYVGE